MYYSTHKFNKLKYQCIDSTFVSNLFGSEIYGRNVQYKSKNGIKISSINDRNGVPIALALAPGSAHDSTILKEQIGNELIDTCTLSVAKNNRYKQIILGDSAYHDKSLYSALSRKGYQVITDVNIRNTKNKIKIQKLKKSKKEYIKKCPKRFSIERSYAWIKSYPKLSRVVEKSSLSYSGLLLLACSFVASKKIT